MMMAARRISLIFSSLLSLTGAGATLLSPLPQIYGGVIAAAVFVGLLWDRRGTHPLPRRLLTLLGAAGFLFTLLPVRRETLAEQSLAALSILLAVKLLDRKARRDHLQILALSAVITVGAGSLAPDLAFGALIILVCLFGTFFLVWLPFSDLQGTALPHGLLRRLAAVTSSLLLLTLPLSLILFIILPRAVSPFWGGLAPSQQKVSGFSEEIRLGEVGRLALSRDIAFRAEMVSPPGPLVELPYWRGVVMENTDGRRWTASQGPVAVRYVGTDQTVRIVYYVEPHGEHQLFLLEQPETAYLGFRPQSLSRERTLRLRSPLLKRIRYQGLSLPGITRPGKISGEERRRNLLLPEDFSPRIRELAGRLTEGAADPREESRRLLAFFDSGFTYSLDLPRTEGDPLEDFIFRSRVGYCEYFAAALAVMLRAAEVPARLVAGYLGGKYNAAGNYYLVTQAEAHTWVEAWIGEEGWVRLDPTPAGGELGGTFASRTAPKPSLWLDSLRMKWNSWVVQYDAEIQIGLVRSARSLFRIRLPRFTGKGVLRILPWLILPAALWLVLRLRRGRSIDPLPARYRRFERIMMRRGVRRLAHEGPLDFSRRIAKSLPEAAWPAKSFAAEYARLHYGGRSAGDSDLATLDLYLRELRLSTSGRGGGPES